MFRPCLLVVVATLAAAPVVAAMPKLPERPVSRNEVVVSVKKHFAAIDINHDGYVSRAEFDRYQQRDAGESSGSEYGHIGAKWFDKSDVDGDGRVSEAEALARPLNLFDMADTNGDGVVSVKERQMAMLLAGLKK